MEPSLLNIARFVQWIYSDSLYCFCSNLLNNSDEALTYIFRIQNNRLNTPAIPCIHIECQSIVNCNTLEQIEFKIQILFRRCVLCFRSYHHFRLYIFYVYWCRPSVNLLNIGCLCFVFSGLFIIVGLCIFGFKVAEEIESHGHDDWFLSWSFSLACTAFVLNQIAASILVTENKRLFKEEQQNERDTLIYKQRGLQEELTAFTYPT